MNVEERRTKPFDEECTVLGKSQTINHYKLPIRNSFQHPFAKPALTLRAMDLHSDPLARGAIRSFSTGDDLIVDHQAKSRVSEAMLLENACCGRLSSADFAADFRLPFRNFQWMSGLE